MDVKRTAVLVISKSKIRPQFVECKRVSLQTTLNVLERLCSGLKRIHNAILSHTQPLNTTTGSIFTINESSWQRVRAV